MRFDSAEFLFFFAAVLLLHRLVARRRLLLILASYGFYASWNPPFLLLLLASTAIDFGVGRRLGRTEGAFRRRGLLLLSLLCNLGVLAYFKYFNFLLDQLVALGIGSGGELLPFYVESQIPLGISFYTFQTLSYTIDVYRRRVEPCLRFGDFALFVAFFPQLIAGPVLRAAEFIPQIRRDPLADEAQTLDGIELCLVGLFKKVVLADNFAVLVDRCYETPEVYSGAALLLATFAFSCQIYCDFSGYSTIARGLAKLLGYELPRNFNFPLLTSNPLAYRRGWHITMGNWFRDYIYHPLGGDRRGTARMVVNVMLTWAAFGLWHGAAWSFVAWGFYNGVLLALYRLAVRWRLLPEQSIVTRAVGFMLMPVFISVSLIFFRAADLGTAALIFDRIGSWAPGSETIHPGWALALAIAYATHWLSRFYYREDLLAHLSWPARIVVIAVMLVVLMLFAGSGEPFYYFQF